MMSCLAIPLCAAAQPDRSSWGVSGTFVPRWETPQEARVVFDADAVDVKGTEFRIGVVHGRTYGGDWGVSFVRKTFKEGSRVERGGGEYCLAAACVQGGTTFTTRDLSLTGVEIHKFASFATIKHRVQIGIEFGGGVAQVSGTAERTVVTPIYAPDPRTQRYTVTTAEERSDVKARELFFEELKTVPLGRLELAVATILAPGAKVRLSGGLNFPGYEVFSVTFVYLFGRH
jgi:hypothetical protein